MKGLIYDVGELMIAAQEALQGDPERWARIQSTTTVEGGEPTQHDPLHPMRVAMPDDAFKTFKTACFDLIANRKSVAVFRGTTVPVTELELALIGARNPDALENILRLIVAFLYQRVFGLRIGREENCVFAMGRGSLKRRGRTDGRNIRY